MDKMKETATKAGDAAKGAAKAGQDKLEEQKLKKKIADLQEELGGVVYAQRTGAANPTADASFDASIDRLVAEITEQVDALDSVGNGDEPVDDTSEGGDGAS
ncbi:MAG: hypothetical protein FJW95_11630 [Actinobacteria bacterium]|nr:hypothetical protein [Actinomycetota bacterium]